LEGHWNVPARVATAERLLVQTPKSNMRGTAHLSATSMPSWELHVDSAGLQAADLLAWYRAFHPDVDEKITAEQFFTGAMTLRGWPLELQDAAFSSLGGALELPGLSAPLRVSAFSGGRQRARLIAGPVRISYGAVTRGETAAPSGATIKRRGGPESKSFAEISFTHDFARHSGSVSLDGHLEKVEDALVVAAGFGRRLNHGWELSGPVRDGLGLEWDALQVHTGWNGRIDVTNGTLQAAGLNHPLQINKARLEWNNGVRTAQIAEIDAFGALWSGQVTQPTTPDSDPSTMWNFQLHAN